MQFSFCILINKTILDLTPVQWEQYEDLQEVGGKGGKFML